MPLVLRLPSLLASVTSAAAALALAAACGGTDTAVGAAEPPDAALPSADAAGVSDASTATGDATTDGDGSNDAGAAAALAAMDKAIEGARASFAADAGAPPALAFALYDKSDRLVFSKSYGGFSVDDRVAVASASKLVSGLVLFSVIGKGSLSLDSTTGAVLGWPAPKDAITLRQLLSFTSGLPPEADCTSSLVTTLGQCVDEIKKLEPTAAPGSRFDYGSTHLHVAARMAEVATGSSWAALFNDNVRTPLGLPAEVAYFTAPRQSLGKQNPLIAGGLRISTAEYAKILAAVYKRGQGAVTAPPTLFDAQQIEPYPTAVVGNSPMVSIGLPFRYGLTAWLECGTPATGCATIASAGAFGFTPFLNRDAGYYAILGMQLERTAVGAGVVEFAVRLEQDLKPLIPAALGP
jgi:serine-type D-Ala-D-Ala carboxypeptidase/endopeptidase